MALRDQQIFIQALMHGGIINEPAMEQLCRKVFDKEVQMGTRDQVSEEERVPYYIEKVNRRLKDLGMGIKSANCELTGEKYWLFTSTVIPELENFNYDHKPFLEFTKAELKFLSKIFGEIISSQEGYISSVDCINSVGEMEEHFTRSQADEFIKKMTLRKWLSVKDGQIYLGVRSIIEFMPLFRAKFNENLENCSLCKKTVFYGAICDDCNVKCHTHCLTKFLEKDKNAKCYNCRSALNVSSASVDESMDTDDPPVPSTSRRSSRKIKTK